MNIKKASTPFQTLAATLALVAWTAAPSEAQGPQVRILVNGLYNAQSLSFTDAVTFTSFLEEASSTRSYDRGTGFVFEAGAIVGIVSGLGVMGSFELLDGATDAQFQEILPHPFFFAQPRSLEGQISDLSYTEQALHLDAVFTADLSPAIVVDVFGGPTFFFTNTQVISTVSSTSEYPFDEVQLASTETVELDDDPIGFNVGGSLTYRITETFGLAFQARYSQATVSLASGDGSAIEFDAGGFRAGGGIRLSF